MGKLGDNEDTTTFKFKSDSNEAKKDIASLQKILDQLEKSTDSVGTKLTKATQNFNKMLSTSLKQYQRILDMTGAGGSSDTLTALALQKTQSKQLNSLYSVNPNRAYADSAKISKKIADDAAIVLADKFSQNLERMLRTGGMGKIKGFNSQLYASSSEYRGVINKGFVNTEKYLVSKVAEGVDVERYIKQLDNLKAARERVIDPINQEIKATEKISIGQKR